MINQAEIHTKAMSNSAEERIVAAEAFGSAFPHLPDKTAAWKDLIQLASTPSHYPDQSPADLDRLIAISEERGGRWPENWEIERAEREEREADLAADIRAAANHSLGRASIFKATEAKDKDTLKRELGVAVAFFEKSYKEAKYRWGGPPRYGPAQFCYPFYRSYLAITFQEAKEDEVQWYLAQAKEAVGGSESKDELLKVIENLAVALQEAERLKGKSIWEVANELNAYRWYCDKAAEHMAAVEDKAPGAVKLMRRCSPIIEEKIRTTIAGIQEKARQICQITRGSGTEYEAPGAELQEAAKGLSAGDISSIQKYSSRIVWQLKKFCRLLSTGDKEKVCEIVEEIEHEPEFPEKLNKIMTALLCLGPVLEDKSPPLADVVILTVLPEEYGSIRNRLSELGPPMDLGSMPNLYAWRFGSVFCKKFNSDYKVIVGMIGRAGTTESALAAREALQLWRPRYVLLSGIAGGLPDPKEEDAHPRLGDVVVADVIYGYEYGKIDKEFKPRTKWTYRTDQALLNGARASALSDGWREHIKAAPPRKCTPDVVSGEIASGDKVVDDPTNVFFAQVLNAWPTINAVEMEGAGAAAAIEQANSLGISTRFMMIRGISDLPRAEGKGKGRKERDAWKDYASDVAAAFIVGWIADGLPLAPSA